MNKQTRDSIFGTAHGRCALCGHGLKANFTVDSGRAICKPCKQSKRSMTLEQYRRFVAGRVAALRRDSAAFRCAERHGVAVGIRVGKVLFYFETAWAR
jgi:hypothetical protein